MLFPSKIFLFYFLPLFALTVFSCRKNKTLWVATVATFSTLFYGWWNWKFLGLIWFSTVVDFTAGKRIAASDDNRTRKKWLMSSIVVNLGLLGFFKYAMFANQSMAHALSWVGIGYPDSWLSFKVLLPVGISFYTFQSMSYTIDIYRRRITPANDLLTFYAYISMFPQLVAGPIVRYSQLAEQLVKPIFSSERIYLGLQFFILGLAKKILIADSLAPLVDQGFSPGGLTSLGTIEAIVAITAYGGQIYFDFSGYSDIAIGSARVLGFDLMQNFRIFSS